jgi:Tripartite ATP-independent periplasmic transporter, DctM component
MATATISTTSCRIKVRISHCVHADGYGLWLRLLRYGRHHRESEYPRSPVPLDPDPRRRASRLALATLITCAMFATATGIVGAVITLMGPLAFPAMLRAGYDVGLSAGLVCAGGCLGILIPPSVMLILFDATASVSVPKLHASALFPGLMLAGFDMLYMLIRCAINPGLAPKLPPEQRKVSFVRIVWSLATSFFPLALLTLSVLGALLSEGHRAAAGEHQRHLRGCDAASAPHHCRHGDVLHLPGNRPMAAALSL